MRLRACAQTWSIPFDKLTQSLRGYDSEAKSHNAVAASIALHKADWGIAIDTVAHDYQLGFTFLQDEHYDFVVPANKITAPVIQAFLALLQSEMGRTGLSRLGFQPMADTGTVIHMAEGRHPDV
jgi:molybdate-binding protein